MVGLIYQKVDGVHGSVRNVIVGDVIVDGMHGSVRIDRVSVRYRSMSGCMVGLVRVRVRVRIRVRVRA